MKSMRAEDRPKAIALSILVIVVFVGIYMRLSSAMGGTPQPPPGAAVSENLSAPSSGGSASPGPVASTTAGSAPAPTAAKNSQIEVPTISTNARNQDPFRSPVKTSVSNDATSGTTPPIANPPAQATPTPPKRTRGQGSSRITEGDITPTGTIGSGGLGGGIAPALPNVGEVKPDEPPPISVTGIVDGGGGRSVAVIRVGDKDYVVSKGDHFGDGFRLVEAYATTIVVTWSKEHRVERKRLSIELPGITQDGNVSGAF